MIVVVAWTNAIDSVAVDGYGLWSFIYGRFPKWLCQLGKDCNTGEGIPVQTCDI